MAIASIFVGIVSGMLSFVVGLIVGQGLLLALGLYILGGLSGMVLTLAVTGLRSRARPEADIDLSLETAQA